MKSLVYVLITAVFLSSVLLTACDNRAQVEAQVQMELARREAEVARQKEMEQRNKDAAYIQKKISQYNVEVQVQRSRLEDIRRPRFLRTPAEKEQQLRQQLDYIQTLEQSLENLAQLKNNIESGLAYEMPVFREDQAAK